MTNNSGSPDAKPASATSDGSDPFGSLMRQFGSTLSASAGAMSAWTDAWQSIMTTRGVPVGEIAMKTLASPREWPTALVPILDEVRTALSLPKFADLPGLDLSALPSLTPLLGLMQVTQDYAAIGLPVWIKASERFQAEAADRKAKDEGSTSAGSLLDVWNNVLDRTLMEFNRSGEFAQAQQRLLQAAVHYRVELRGAFEKAAKAVDMPTRTEMTDIYARLHELTREVHALRREVRSLKHAARSTAGDADAPSTH